MAKPKTPLLSLGASGTIGNALTFQKRGQDTIARKKPTPKDPYSLAQAYRRWDYQDYAYLWTQQSEATKQTYRTRASRYHITGYSLWMKEHLRDLPDLAGRWNLDEKSGAIVHDSSRNAFTGTIFGATPTPGVIDNAYHFDGINDKIVIPAATKLFPLVFSIECFITFHTVGVTRVPLSCFSAPAGVYKGHYFYIASNDAFWFRVGIGVGGIANAISPPGVASLNTLLHAVGVYQTGQLSLYINGSLAAAGVGVMEPGEADLWLGAKSGGGEWSHSTIDQVVYYNRALDIIEIKRHSQRRYPP